MSASNVDKAAAPRQVACETADDDQVPVDLDVLHLSGTFKQMYDDLGLEEHDEFQGVFPVRTVSTRIFNKVIEWCKEHKDAPEPIIEKGPLTQECKWFKFTRSEKRFFDVPMLELLELVMAANFLDIPRLYQYACQSVAAGIKGKCPREVNELLQQRCDLDHAQMRKALDDNPWLSWPCAFHRPPAESAIFIPNEVLVTIFEKLPREDLERLQLINSQFDGVIASSAELSVQQGPRRIVTNVEFGSWPAGQKIDVWLRDGTRATCPNSEILAKRLKFAVVQKLRVWHSADVQDLSSLLPVKSAWRNAIVEVPKDCFLSKDVFEFAFTQLFLCKEIVLGRVDLPSPWSRSCMRLPAIAQCRDLDVSGISVKGVRPTDVVQWLEYEPPPEEKWSEPRLLMIHEDALIRNIDGLLTALKTAFLTASKPKPYAVRIHQCHSRNLNEALENEKTHERLTIRSTPFYVFVTRA